MSELISIIVPVYNTAAYLPECLDSMLTQDQEEISKEPIRIDGRMVIRESVAKLS